MGGLWLLVVGWSLLRRRSGGWLACTACRKRQKTAIGGQDDSSVTEARRPSVSSSAFGDQDGPSVFSFGGQDGPSAIEALCLRNRFKTRLGSVDVPLMPVSELGSALSPAGVGQAHPNGQHVCEDNGE